MVMNLSGAPNFRDAGGLTTQSGTKLKTGVLFRSDELSSLSINDWQKLLKIKIRLICDLRTQKEKKSRLTTIPAGENIRIINIPVNPQGQNWNRFHYLTTLIFRAKKLNFKKILTDFYWNFAFSQTEQIREVFSLLSCSQNLPAVIHCTAGKDRTGLVSALIQSVAGACRDAVMENYLLTNHNTAARLEKSLLLMRKMSFNQITKEQLIPFMEARREYLEPVLDEILRRYGSYEEYLSRLCRIRPDQIDGIKNNLQ